MNMWIYVLFSRNKRDLSEISIKYVVKINISNNFFLYIYIFNWLILIFDISINIFITEFHT